jgi:hypothetical protein
MLHVMPRHTTRAQIKFSINDIPVLFDFMRRALPFDQALTKERRQGHEARVIHLADLPQRQGDASKA